MKTNISIKSDIGTVRMENQDFANYAKKPNVSLGILCDGMGGHSNGSTASKTAVSEFIDFFNETDIENYDPFDKKIIQKWFFDGLNRVDKRMERLAKMDETNEDMGTTLVLVLFFEAQQETYVFNIGDSRAYLYNGFLHQVTKDQNVMNYLIETEDLTEDAARHIMGWDRLTSALGPHKQKTVDIYVIHKDSKPKYIILTSDGVHTYIPKPLFESILKENTDIEDKVQRIVQNAIELKSNDNLTCLIMEVF